MPESALTQAEHDFVESVCDRLDVTLERPSAELRRQGWLDYAEFVEWLRVRYEALRGDGGGLSDG